MPATNVPAALILMNVAYAACSYPIGRLGDRIDRTRVLAFGIAVLIAADIVLASARSVGAVLAGCALWGLHMAATQGLLSAIIADAAPAALRASAFGLFHLAAGVAQLAASVAAGWLWKVQGPPATFLFGAACALAAMIALLLFRPAGRVH
jgi:MFS family permease